MTKLTSIAGVISAFILFALLTGIASPAKAERVALVVGNAQYEHTQPLANPRNDAEAIAAALRDLDFKVFDGYDLTRESFEDLIRNFARGAQTADAAAFYYAGHGLEVGSINYLVPVDAKISDEADLKFEAINLNDILGFMEREQRTNLIFLDACRDNPMARNLSLNMGTRSVAVGRGLAPVDTGVGTLIAYATQPGNVALDGAGRHSPFTSALLDHIATPDLDVAIMMRSVRRDVMQATSGHQFPWSSSSLTGSFAFQVQPKQTEVPTPKLTVAPQPAALPQAPVVSEVARDPEPKTEIALAAIDPTPPETPQDNTDIVLKPDVAPLSERDLARLSQADLNRLGCNAGIEDGIWGRKSRDALERLAKHAPSVEIATLEPTAQLLRQLEGLNGRICPLVCGATEDLIDGACLRKTCAKGQRLSSRGQCYTPKATTSRQRSTSGSGSNCFSLNGQTFCQ